MNEARLRIEIDRKLFVMFQNIRHTLFEAEECISVVDRVFFFLLLSCNAWKGAYVVYIEGDASSC